MMIARGMLPFALLALSACHKGNDLTFDLHCKDKLRTIDNGRRSTSQIDRVYRIDLGSKRYCTDECKESYALTSITPTEIKYSVSGGGISSSFTINRESGHLISTTDWGSGDPDLEMGTCVKAPFSGLPAAKF